MRIVFFGTPPVAAHSLQALLTSTHEVAAVVTQPDRARGRSGAAQASPVKTLALEHEIAVLQPESPKDAEFARALAAHEPDACAVVAYGHLLPASVLAVPPKGTVNVHFSLLPRYRGAAPVQRAIMAGESETGVTVFVLEPTIDTGPIVDVVRILIGPEDTAGTLLERLAPIGADALVRALDAIEAGTARAIPQTGEATPAPKLRPEEAEIEWSGRAAAIRDKIRAFNPSPGAWTTFRGKRVKLWLADVTPGRGAPGAVLDPGEGFSIAAGDGAVRPIELQIEGKRRVGPEEFARGARLAASDRFGSETT